LPRTEVVLNPDAICPNCGGEDFRTISNDSAEILEYIPASFVVIKTIRPRCACKNCETIVQGQPTSGAILRTFIELCHFKITYQILDDLGSKCPAEKYSKTNLELAEST
jgi:transposase